MSHLHEMDTHFFKLRRNFDLPDYKKHNILTKFPGYFFCDSFTTPLSIPRLLCNMMNYNQVQGPEFSANMVNTTVKTELPLENGIHLRKWNFTEQCE